MTRKAEFSASHVCAQPQLSDAANREIYGPAANPKGHGHNYVLEVTLSGEPDPATGMIFDLKTLKEIISREVIEPMDHRFLNYEVRPFDRIVPTAENLAIEIWNRLATHFQQGKGTQLYNVRLYETEDLYVDYSGAAG